MWFGGAVLYPNSLLGSVYNKTLDYVKTFAKFDKPEAAAAIRE